MVEARKHRCLAQELVAGFLSNIFWESAVVLDFLQRALAAFEPGVVGKVDRAHATLTDPITDLVAAAQDLPVLKGWEQCLSFGYSFMAMSLTDLCRRSSAQKRVFMLYYYNTAYWSIPELGCREKS